MSKPDPRSLQYIIPLIWVQPLLAICLWLAGPGSGQEVKAQLLIKETFDYPPGQTLAGQGQATAGWNGPWIQAGGQAGGQVLPDSVVDFSLEIRSRWPVAQLPSGPGNRLERALGKRIELTEGALWLSFLSEAALTNSRNKGTLALIDRSFDSLRTRRLEFGKTWGALQVVSDGVGLYPRSSGEDYLGGKWIVARISPNGPGEARVYTWVDPDPNELPDTARAQIRNQPVSITGIDAIQLIALDEPGLNWKVDDLYLGRDFPSVVPDDWAKVDPGQIERKAREAFEYPAGEGLANRNGGAGFAGPWSLLNSFDHRVVDTAIFYRTGEQTIPPLLALHHDNANSNARYIRRLAAPFTDDGQVYWMGAVLDIDYTAGGNVAQAFLGNINELGPSGPAGQYLQIGKSFQEDRFSLGVPPNNFVFLDETPARGSYFVAVRIRTSGNESPELVDIWIDPDPIAAEPPEEDIAQSMSLPINAGWNALGMKVEGEAGVHMLLDELAVGQTYQDIVPADPVSFLHPAKVEDRWSLYPNPGNGKGRLLSLGKQGSIDRIEVYDANGRLIRQLRAVATDTRLRFLPPNSPNGSYLLRLWRGAYAESIIYLKQ